MAKKMHDTPMLDQLESGPWPSFVTGLKRLAKDKDYVVDLLAAKVSKLREMSPLYEMAREGIDLKTIQWAAH